MPDLESPDFDLPDFESPDFCLSEFCLLAKGALVQRSGIRILSADLVDEDARDAGARFLWVIGRVD